LHVAISPIKPFTGSGFFSAADTGNLPLFISTPPFVIMALAAIYSLFIINKSGGLIYKVYSCVPGLFFPLQL
jgi:hypothetical protein